MANNLDMLDKLQDAILVDEGKKKLDSKYRFDNLKMYFGEDFEYKGITVSMPTIGDILEIGEEKFYQDLSPFLYNSTSIRVMLWENGVDWTKIKDIEVFDILFNLNKAKYESENITKIDTLDVIFKNISFEDFKLVTIAIEDENQLALYNSKTETILFENDYMVIAEYIREIFNAHPKVEKAKSKTAKSWMIQEDKINAQIDKENKSNSTLLPLISSCVNHPGFKYKLQDLKEVGIYQFMDSVKRIQKYESGTAALKGCYSGFIDGSKIDKDLLNYMGDI